MSLSNKSSGTSFEKMFAKCLVECGFWARMDKGYSQTCDIIAGKNNEIYIFECKVCKSDYFNLDRVEDNQRLSRERFNICGNKNAWMVYQVGEAVYLSREPIKRPSEGIPWEVWRLGN